MKCKQCNKTFSIKTGHSSLKYHVKTHEKSVDKTQSLIASYFKTSEKTFDDLLLEFIIRGQHPFCIVSENGFKKLIHSLNPNTSIMSRITVKRKCIEL